MVHPRSIPARPRRWRASRRAATALLGLALALPACATRVVEDKILFDDGITITLRSQERRGEPIDRGFQHPAVLSAERLSYILGAIEIRDESGDEARQQQMGAFTNELIEPLSRLLALAFEQAAPSQEIVVQAVRKQSHLKLFNEKYLTSFITYVQGDSLYFHLSRIEWEIPKKKSDRAKKLPTPQIGDEVMEFSTLSTRGVYKVGRQSAAVTWRDPLFAQPLPIRGSGRQRTRTILDEMPIPADERPVAIDPGLSAKTLRALADLEEARAAGEITEGQYQQQRQRLLSGR